MDCLNPAAAKVCPDTGRRFWKSILQVQLESSNVVGGCSCLLQASKEVGSLMTANKAHTQLQKGFLQIDQLSKDFAGQENISCERQTSKAVKSLLAVD